MKLSLLALLALGTSTVTAAPQIERDATALSERAASIESLNALEKRKGGGGGGGKGGGGGGSSGGKSGGGSGGGSSGGGGGGSRGAGSANSNTGGRTTTGSGPPPTYGNRYMGGATVPYTAGTRAPSKNILPYAIGGAAVGGFGAYYAASWIYPVYGYSYYPTVYSWNDGGRNITTNITCLCQSYQVCGCDPTDDQSFVAQMVTDNRGNGAPVNTSIVSTAVFPNGTAITYINGSLANGTTAPGGTESPTGGANAKVVTYGGYGIMAATVLASVLVL